MTLRTSPEWSDFWWQCTWNHLILVKPLNCMTLVINPSLHFGGPCMMVHVVEGWGVYFSQNTLLLNFWGVYLMGLSVCWGSEMASVTLGYIRVWWSLIRQKYAVSQLYGHYVFILVCFGECDHNRTSSDRIRRLCAKSIFLLWEPQEFNG